MSFEKSSSFFRIGHATRAWTRGRCVSSNNEFDFASTGCLSGRYEIVKKAGYITSIISSRNLVAFAGYLAINAREINRARHAWHDTRDLKIHEADIQRYQATLLLALLRCFYFLGPSVWPARRNYRVCHPRVDLCEQCDIGDTERTQTRALISISPVRGAKGRRRVRRKWYESHFH